MGYLIVQIEEIDTFDFSPCPEITNSSTVRRSVNGQKFVVFAPSFNQYTHAEILLIMDTEEWTDTDEI